MRVLARMTGHPQMAKIVGALAGQRGFADYLHRGNQQTDQHADDGEDDEEFHEADAGSRRENARMAKPRA